jgi:hypothetical protein
LSLAEQLVHVARDLGVHLAAEGGKLAAYGQLSDDLRSLIREHRDEILEELRREAATTPNVIQPADGVARSKSESALVYVPSLGRELWISSDPDEAARLRPELAADDVDRPVVIADDIVKLASLPTEGLLAAVRGLCAFPGARAVSVERLPDLPDGAVYFTRRDGSLRLERVIGDPDDPSAEAPTEAPVELVRWSRKLGALVTWFERALADGRLPAEPFQLDAGGRVADPKRWYRSLEQDIAAGARGARAGALVEELRRLRELVGGGDRRGLENGENE